MTLVCLFVCMSGDPIIEQVELERYSICLRESQHPDLPDVFGRRTGDTYIFVDTGKHTDLGSLRLAPESLQELFDGGEWDPNARLTDCELCGIEDEEVGVWDFDAKNFFVHKSCFEELLYDIEDFCEGDAEGILSRNI